MPIQLYVLMSLSLVDGGQPRSVLIYKGLEACERAATEHREMLSKATGAKSTIVLCVPAYFVQSE